MRGFILAVVAVVLGAAALSIAILPDRRELGTMYLRDRKYEESRELFERQVAEGDLSAQTVSALLTIYLQYGDVDRAIGLIRRYGNNLGDRPDVMARLVDLYAADMRLGLYRQTLARLAAVEPTPERYEALADAALRAADREAQFAALQELVARDWATPPRLLEYADLAIATGRVEAALEPLLALAERNPELLDWSYRLLLLRLLLRSGDGEQALAMTARWLDREEPEAVRVSVAQLWLEAGFPDRALGVLDDRAAMERHSEAWRAAYILALRRAGRTDAAYARLTRWLDLDLVTPTLATDLVDLAVARGEFATALATFDRIGAKDLPSPAVLLLVSGLHQAGLTDDVDRVVAALGDGRMAELPVLAAQIAVARGDREGARRWAEVALGRAVLSDDDRIGLAPVLIEIGEEARAIALLRPIADEASPPWEAMLLLGELYARSPDPETGYWELNALLARHYTPELRALWAELGLATGRFREVEEWLARTREIRPQTLDNLFYLAERRDSWTIAVAAAERMLELRPSDRIRERLAYALLREGRVADALAVYDAVEEPSPASEPIYEEILRSLGLTDRLVALWQRQMARPGIAREQVEQLVYNLLDAGADAVALPHLVDLAGTAGGVWWFALAEAAARAGQGDMAADAITQAIEGRPPEDDSLSALIAALEIAAPHRSPDVLRGLADRSPSLWADSYAIVMTERGRVGELNAWLKAQLAASEDTSEALRFAQRLAESADPLDAARAIRPRAGSSRGWAELYVDLLRRGDRPQEAMAFLVDLASDGRIEPQWRREIAFQALEAGNREAADRLFRSIAATDPPDSPTVQQLFYLWGPRPEPSALDWVEARARAATGAERLAWLERLLAVRAGDRVIAVIGGVGSAASPQEIDLVVRAEAQGSRPEALRETVTAAVGRTSDLDTLVSLARTAETTRDRKLIVEAWRAVVTAAPDHPAANRQLGLIAYDEGRLIDSERHLRAFLAGGAGDYEANYFLGEILFRTGRRDQAGPYYRRAYDQLSELTGRDFYHEVARANILRRLGRLDDAVALMDSLLKQRPGDRALRADFADLLIEKGDFARARYVLQHR